MNKQKTILCKFIYDEIKNLNESEIEETFKILHKNNTLYTRNNNGIFVNLSWMDIEILEKIKNYIIYCINSHKESTKYEFLKDELSTSIKKIENDETISIISQELVLDEKNSKIKKINSNMKFYLAKKKLDFNKDKKIYLIMDDILTYDKPI